MFSTPLVLLITSFLLVVLMYGSIAKFDVFALRHVAAIEYADCQTTKTYPNGDKASTCCWYEWDEDDAGDVIPATLLLACEDCIKSAGENHCGGVYYPRTGVGPSGPLAPPTAGAAQPPTPPPPTNELPPGNNVTTMPPGSIIKVPPGATTNPLPGSTTGNVTNPGNNTSIITKVPPGLFKPTGNLTNVLPTGNNTSTSPTLTVTKEHNPSSPNILSLAPNATNPSNNTSTLKLSPLTGQPIQTSGHHHHKASTSTSLTGSNSTGH